LGADALLSCIYLAFFGFIFKTFVVTTRDTGKKLLLQFFTFVLIYYLRVKLPVAPNGENATQKPQIKLYVHV